MLIRSSDSRVMSVCRDLTRGRPSDKDVRDAISFFAPIYARLLSGTYGKPVGTPMAPDSHYAIFGAALTSIAAKKRLGRIIAEPGCGPAQNLVHLMEGPLHDTIFNVEARREEGPVLLVGVDNNPDMIAMADQNFSDHLSPTSLSRMPMASQFIELDKKEDKAAGTITFSIFYKKGNDRLELLRVKLYTQSAVNLDYVKPELESVKADRFDTAILSYCLHWFRSENGNPDHNEKLQLLEATRDLAVLIISMEEFKLTVHVRIDGSDVDDPILMKLATLVDEGTTPITMAERTALIMKANLYQLCDPITLALDRYHDLSTVVVSGTQLNGFKKDALGLYVLASS